MNEEKCEIKYPCDWEFRAFCLSGRTDELMKEFAAVTDEIGTEAVVEAGETSKSGNYRTVRITATVQNREMATMLAERFGRLEGVKFML